MINNKRIFVVVTLLYIIYTVFPLFADIFSIPVWLPSIATVLVIVLLFPSAFKNRLFYWFLVYAAVLTVNLLMGRDLTIGIGTVDDEKKIFIEFAYILPAIAIFCVLYYLKDDQVNRRIAVWSIVILYLSFIVAVPLMLRYNSLREALSIEGREMIHIAGLPGYSLMHSYTFFLPVMCYATKTMKGWKKILSIIGIIVLSFVIYDTFVTTSLIVGIAIIFVSLIYKGGDTTVFWFTGGFLLLVIYTLYLFGLFISLIDWMMPAFEDTPVESKLLDFRASMVENTLTGGTIEGRLDLHRKSWDSFMQNPLLGMGASNVGNHSSLLDRFGGMGFIAGFPFVMIFVSFIKRMVKMYETKTAKVFFWIGTICAFIFLYQKGNWGGEAWLIYMSLMPMGIKTFENKVLSDESRSS